jgi:DNA-binding NarL/FixJ family response regulator
MGAPVGQEACPVCDRAPVVLVAVRHPVMRRWVVELLASEHGCWRPTEPGDGELLGHAIARTSPELVVVDHADFPACCREALDSLPPERVVVVGPEPDVAYRDLALGLGAAGWVSRDEVGEGLSAVMRSALGCVHAPCPPGGRAVGGAAERSEEVRTGG